MNMAARAAQAVARRVHWLPTRARSAFKLATNPPIENSEARISIVIRYSIAIGGGGSWKLGRNKSASDYLGDLYDPNRLDQRYSLFMRFVLPSLCGQSLPMKKGLRDLTIVTSTALPSDHQSRLQDIASAFDWIDIRHLPLDAPSITAPEHAGYFASVRLDDDDALGRDFLSRLSGYVGPKYEGYAISFPNGYLTVLGNDLRCSLFARRWSPCTSQGLSYIVGPNTRHRSIYQVGPHHMLDRFAPVIIDPHRGLYVRTIYDGQDSVPPYRRRQKHEVPGAEVLRDIAMEI